MSDLPKDYDVIVVGTGLTESIVSAALSRIGKIVLHIDRETFYGGESSSHSLGGLIEWSDQLIGTKKDEHTKKERINSQTNENLTNVECNNDLRQYYTHFKSEWNKKACSNEIKESLMKLSRRFSLDLCPNIFYSRGSFIELLISSDVSKYCEFRLVSQILTLTTNKNDEIRKLEKVPTSRSDVFKTNQLSMIEKRHMMKFIQSCSKDNQFADFINDEPKCKETSFRYFLKEKKLPDSVSMYILNAVAMSPSNHNNQTVMQGLNQVKKFLSSVGRFGDSPFLYSMYGTGELSQSYCRLAAVFGAIFHLNLTIDEFVVNKETNSIESIIAKAPNSNLSLDDDNEPLKSFNCKHLIMDSSYLPLSCLQQDKIVKQISRCILITDKSIFQNDQNSSTNPEENISLLYLPKTSEKVSDIHCLEASSATQCCPKGYYLIYLFCEQINFNEPENDFQEFIDMFFQSKKINEKEVDKDEKNAQTLDDVIIKNDTEIQSPESITIQETKTEEREIPSENEESEEKTKKPKILFEFYFSHIDSQDRIENSLKSNTELPSNLYITTGSRATLDFDHHVTRAKEIFKKICSEEEFLPKPPDQEDIIMSDDVNEQKIDEKESDIDEQSEVKDSIEKVEKGEKKDEDRIQKEEEDVNEEDKSSPTVSQPNEKKSRIDSTTTNT